jgi:hypothetical protein
MVRNVSIAMLVLLWLGTSQAAAQDRPAPAIDLAAGWVGFADDGIVSETMVGGGGRWYLTQRIAIGPELIYIAGSNHSHLVLTGNVTVDLLRPSGGAPRPVTPFIVIGGGLFQTREQFLSVDYLSSEGAFTVGGGVRVAAGARVTLGVDARLGWETHIRVNGVMGIRLWR